MWVDLAWFDLQEGNKKARYAGWAQWAFSVFRLAWDFPAFPAHMTSNTLDNVPVCEVVGMRMSHVAKQRALRRLPSAVRQLTKNSMGLCSSRIRVSNNFSMSHPSSSAGSCNWRSPTTAHRSLGQRGTPFCRRVTGNRPF